MFKFLKRISLSKEENNRLQKILKTEKNQRLLSTMTIEKPEAEETCHFFFKIIFVTIFYFCILPNYGWLLFIMMLLISLFTLAAYWVCYLIFELAGWATDGFTKNQA